MTQQLQFSLVESPRVLLRPFRPADAPALTRLFDRNRQHIGRSHGNLPSDLFAVLEYIRACQEEVETERRSTFGVFVDDQLVGIAELTLEGNAAVLGYGIGIEHAGR